MFHSSIRFSYLSKIRTAKILMVETGIQCFLQYRSTISKFYVLCILVNIIMYHYFLIIHYLMDVHSFFNILKIEQNRLIVFFHKKDKMLDVLPIQDASTGVIDRNSSRLCSFGIPLMAAITIVGKAKIKPKSIKSKFFTVVAMNCSGRYTY